MVGVTMVGVTMVGVTMGVTMVGVTMVGVTMVGVTVVGVTMVGVTMVGVTVDGVTMVGVTMFGITMFGVTMVGVTVVGVTMVGVTMVGVTMVGVTMFGVTMFGVTMVGVTMVGVTMVGVTVVGVTSIGVTMVGVTMVGVNMVGVTMVGVTMVGVTMFGVTMVGVTMVGVTMVGVTMVGVTMVGVTMVGVTMVGVTMVGVTMVGVTLVGVTMVASLWLASLCGHSLQESLDVLNKEKYFDPKLDLAELRIDFILDFTDHQSLTSSAENLVQQIHTYCQRNLDQIQDCLETKEGQELPRFVLTLREKCQGGQCPDTLARETFLAILNSCIDAFSPEQLAYVDIDEALLQQMWQGDCINNEETDRFWRLLLQKKITLIASFHDFGTFAGSAALWQRVQNLNFLLREIATALKVSYCKKIAVMVSSSAELSAFYRFARKFQAERETNYILLAVGEYGSTSRILSPLLGGMWTYCHPSGCIPIARGQCGINELVDLYNYRNLSPDSTIYGEIGNPIAHSLSAETYNQIFHQKGWDAVYLRFLVDDLAAFFDLIELLPIRGFSCTAPHKGSLALQLKDGVLVSTSGDKLQTAASPSCAIHMIEECNLLYRSSSQSLWHGDNTEVECFLQPLLRLASQLGINLKGKKAAIIGAEGVAKVVVYALLSVGMNCEIYHHTLTKAQDLQLIFEPYFECKSGTILNTACLGDGRDIARDCLVLVQTTSVGVHSGKDNSCDDSALETSVDPIPGYQFSVGQIAYDLNYNIKKTCFLSRAESAGSYTLNGLMMLQEQVQRQVKIFESHR
ncbi:hypothetical protein Btru_030802 [Bulinus truncatus]|nr:hypothetical protein Btru_030802 [Bulinus truncatus]